MKPVKQYKLSRRLQIPLFEKCQTQKFALSEQKKVKKRSKFSGRPLSRFGQQLLEKQKLRFFYGLNERVLRNYVRQSLKSPNKESTLIELLERRADSITYNSGIVPTRRMARQMVSHGHFLVNGVRTNVPSRHIKNTDEIGFREGSKKTNMFKILSDKKVMRKPSEWITVDTQKLTIKMDKIPTHSNVPFDLATIFEYYLR